jgi:mannose-1-phosphate guanylyltransferase
VAAFVEKPTAERARRMVRSGRYLWNSGMFAWRASSILDELRRHRPGIAAPLQRWSRRGRRAGPWWIPAAVLRRVPALSVDRAVLERSERVLVTPGAFRWADVGNWEAVGRLLIRDTDGNASVGGLLAIDSRRCVAFNEGGLTVLVGVEDLVAVRSGDALLVCHRGSAQRVREAVRRLRRVSPRHL